MQAREMAIRLHKSLMNFLASLLAASLLFLGLAFSAAGVRLMGNFLATRNFPVLLTRTLDIAQHLILIIAVVVCVAILGRSVIVLALQRGKLK